MKTRRALLLDAPYSGIASNLSIDNYQDNSTIARKENQRRKISKKNKPNKNEPTLIHQLRQLVTLFPDLPILLAGPLRHLKVEPHYREPRARLLRNPRIYRKTSKIRLTGNWIENAGFTTHERIRVIPMNRMLIIVPEEVAKKRKAKKYDPE
jgi:hypothetical protein